jgi:hypothetical protein
LKVGFPASKASRFFARAKLSFRVGFVLRHFFGFVFRETLERVVLARFKGRFFFGIVY